MVRICDLKNPDFLIRKMACEEEGSFFLITTKV
jgi:hypothetical protein